jgi:hypothetical protein
MMIMDKAELINGIIELIVMGYSRTEIIGILNDNLMETDEKKAGEVIQEAVKRMETISNQNLETVVNIHVAMYEDIFRYFNSVGHTSGCNKSMKAKEKLLGLLSGRNKITINNVHATIPVQERVLNTDVLDPADQTRIEELLTKMKTTPQLILTDGF